MGCVIAEMMLGQPLFPGESSVEQLVEIIKVLGTPTKEQIISMNPNYTDFKFPQIKAMSFSKIFRPRTPVDAIDLLANFLRYVPTERLNPIEALAHPFFDELRSPNLKLTDGKSVTLDLFDFTEEEKAYINTKKDLYAKIVPDW